MALKVATPANPPANPYAQHTSDTCEHCGEAIFYAVSASAGSTWRHFGTYNKRCPKVSA